MLRKASEIQGELDAAIHSKPAAKSMFSKEKMTALINAALLTKLHARPQLCEYKLTLMNSRKVRYGLQVTVYVTKRSLIVPGQTLQTWLLLTDVAGQLMAALY
jgi:hypothetical protein